MTIANRSKIIFFGILLSLFSSIGSFVISLQGTNSPFEFSFTQFKSQAIWWFFSKMNTQPPPHIQTLWISLAICLFAFVILIVIFYFFHKSTSPEIFFFSLLIISLSANVLRPLHYYLIINNNSFYYGILISRSLYFSYFLGILSLFTASLFAVGFPYQRLNISIGVIFLVAFLFAYVIPLDGTNLQANFIYTSSNDFPTGPIIVLIQLLSCANFLYGAFLHNNNESIFQAIGCFLVIGGYDLLFFQGTLLLTLLGMIFITIGSLIFIRKTYTLYLWQ